MEQLSNPWWLFVLLGVIAGIFSGTLGIGGGVVIVPALALFFGFAQKSSQGIALMVMVPMAFVGAYRYWINPEIEVNRAVAGLVICGAIFGAFAGAELAGRLPSNILRKIFAIVLMLIAWRMFVTPVKPKTDNLETASVEIQKIDLDKPQYPNKGTSG